MIHLFVQSSKYLMLLLFLIYTYFCFHVFKYNDDTSRQKGSYTTQRFLMFLIHLDGFLVLYVTTNEIKLLGFYVAQIILFEGIYIIYHKFYKNASELVLNNMIMLLSIGMIILTRISYEKAVRQFVFLVAGSVIALFIPLVIQKVSMFRNFTWVYAAVGILLLLVVCVAGSVSYGAKLSLSFGGITIQPSEFVKIIFVFYIASMLRQEITFRQFMITSAVSAVFVLILVASKDLGGALLYFFTYLMIAYAATKKFYVFVGGIGFLTLAAFLAGNFFSHVQTRVTAWSDPLAVIDKEGFQICQSLFAIGTGGWFGLGLNQGMPSKIPVVEKDFVFSAIAEEMGGAFALCLIMVCISCFLMIFNLSMQMKDKFFKLVALGLGSIYALQVFLTIGGVTKFIPSTGVTLPLISYGGSSLLSTIIIFGIIQGLYIMQSVEISDKKKPLKRRADYGRKQKEKN